MKVTKRKLILMTAMMCITALMFVYGTMAYFTNDSTSQNNVINSGEIKIELIESGSSENNNGGLVLMPGVKTERSLEIKNRGNLPTYVRVSLSPEITLSAKESANADKVDVSVVEFEINKDYWIELGEYYYYKMPVRPGEKTEPLYTSVSFSQDIENMYKGSTTELSTLVSAVQSNGNGASVLEAKGWAEVGKGGNKQ